MVKKRASPAGGDCGHQLRLVPDLTVGDQQHRADASRRHRSPSRAALDRRQHLRATARVHPRDPGLRRGRPPRRHSLRTRRRTDRGGCRRRAAGTGRPDKAVQGAVTARRAAAIFRPPSNRRCRPRTPRRAGAMPRVRLRRAERRGLDDHQGDAPPSTPAPSPVASAVENASTKSRSSVVPADGATRTRPAGSPMSTRTACSDATRAHRAVDLHLQVQPGTTRQAQRRLQPRGVRDVVGVRQARPDRRARSAAGQVARRDHGGEAPQEARRRRGPVAR